MTKSNRAKEEARRIVNAVGFADAPGDVIAAALQQVADECADISDWAALPEVVIRAKFPKEGA